MQRNTQARILVVTVLLGTLGVGLARKGVRSEGAASPATVEEAISASICGTTNAARAGDAGRYLAGYTGPMRAALQRELDDGGAASFARYLRSLDVGVKGLAVWVESIGEQEAKARVEYVYEDRNNVQVVHLEKERGAWRIVRTEGDQIVKAAIPYGTPIR